MTEKLRVEIGAEDRFSRTFANLRRELSGASDQFGGLARAVAAVNGVAGRLALGSVAGAAGFAAGVRMLANDLDALNDSVDATGTSVEMLSALEDVARRNGGTLDLATTSLVKLNHALTEAKPDSDLARSLQAIGLDAEQLRRIDPAEALLQIAKALQGYANDGNKARFVQEAFGKSLREVAPFLKDLAEAGQLNATVTAEQAAEAEKFNKQLYALQTNSYNAARTLAADLLPALNSVIDKARRMSAKTFLQELASEVQAARLNLVVERIEALSGAVSKEPGNRALVQALADAREEYTRLSKAAADANQRLKETLGIPAEAPNAGGGRGFVNPPWVTPRLPDRADRVPKSHSEAQRYLETLQKQVEALESQQRIEGEVVGITAARRLELDLQARRIEGITPALERQLKAEADRLDTLRAIDKIAADGFAAMKGVEDTARSLLMATPTGQLARLNADADAVLRVARANSSDPRIQRAASEAMAELRRKQDDIIHGAEKGQDAFDRLADTIEKGMDRATSAVLDFAIEGKGGLEDVGRAFARDIARGLLEEPIRDEVKRLGKSIADTLRNALNGEDIFGPVIKGLQQLMSNIGNSGGGGRGGGGGWLDTVIKWWDGLGGGTTRAMGGNVRAGQLVRWQENGREWFVPQQDGAVVTQQQLRAASAPAPSISTVVNINGNADAATVRLIQLAIEANNVRLLRGMRLGGLTAS